METVKRVFYLIKCKHLFISVISGIDVKRNVDPKNKKTYKTRFYGKNKKLLKTLNKNWCWQINKIIQTKWKKFSTKITVLLSYSVQNNVWELWLFI